ncbi:hypothetical protein N1031_05670 [Herbiconiux moechotypicola]|nr:hypothetical protein [Herbiconiux moechotypicola]MCS5729244.1 hypothetical protein [Herbiconiux moechotypicola]
MDLVFVAAAMVGAVLLAVIGIPRMMRSERTRQRSEFEAGERGVAGFGVVDELFNPSARNAVFERQAQLELPAPAPAPGDPPLESGRIRITLPPE